MVTSSIPTAAVSNHEFDFDAGRLCLDFANTVPVHPASGGSTEHPDNHRALDSYGDLVDWSKGAGQIDEQTARRLLSNAARDEDGARRALARAIDLREVIYRLIVAAISGARADQVEVLAFDSALRDARARLRLVQDGDAFGWRWADLADSIDGPLGPVLESAAQLLTSPADLARVRRCGGESCDWLFIDNTKNRSRRWCSMSGCGNRAKARRHYQRKRDADRGV